MTKSKPAAPAAIDGVLIDPLKVSALQGAEGHVMATPQGQDGLASFEPPLTLEQRFDDGAFAAEGSPWIFVMRGGVCIKGVREDMLAQAPDAQDAIIVRME